MASVIPLLVFFLGFFILLVIITQIMEWWRNLPAPETIEEKRRRNRK
jgi:hypothetical protein